MSSRILFAFAVVCMFAVANGAATIEWLSFEKDGCTGTVTSASNTTTGECSGSGSHYSAQYCSNDGASIFTVSFSKAGCNDTNAITSMQRVSTNQCGYFMAKYQQRCVNAAEGPAVPLSFPPAGWSTSTTSYNLTSSSNAKTCGNTGAGFTTIDSASKLGNCVVQEAGFGQSAGSYATYCSADGANAGTGYFTSLDCSGSVARAELSQVGCTNGVQSSCPSGATVFPSLPNIGIVQFDNDMCTQNKQTSVTLFASATCFNGQKFACSTVNGTTVGTLSTFSDSTNKGLCSTVATETTERADGVTCTKKQQKFTCDFSPIINGAASASTSIVALAVAAIVALFATRSL